LRRIASLSRRQALLWLGGGTAAVALGYILGLRSGIRGVNWFTIYVLWRFVYAPLPDLPLERLLPFVFRYASGAASTYSLRATR
jgi:hypothetical protein